MVREGKGFPAERQGLLARSFSFLVRCPPLPAWVFASLVLGACDDSFSPIAPGEVHLSVFGYLDASADTQWVRVMPIRPSIPTSPDSLGAEVTLEPLGTGRIIRLRDSVFHFSHYVDPELGSQGAYLHNFWTAERIEPGAEYRFSVVGREEEPAEALVEIPAEYEVEVWLKQVSYETDYLRIAGVEHVPFVVADAYFHDRCGSSVDSLRFDKRSGGGEGVLVPIRKEPVVPREGCGSPGVEKRELWVVGSEMEWPSGQAYSTQALAVPEGPSNVSNAVGFLGGVLTKIVPYEECRFQGGEGDVPDHCRLRYGPESATLRGTVREVRCGDGPIDSVTVELRELDRDPPAVRRVRTTLSNRAGSFEIGGLEGAGRYALVARAKPEPDPFWGEVDVYTLHFDTLSFAPGEEAEYGILLRRLTACGSHP